jgi:hypothetical protein
VEFRRWRGVNQITHSGLCRDGSRVEIRIIFHKQYFLEQYRIGGYEAKNDLSIYKAGKIGILTFFV